MSILCYFGDLPILTNEEKMVNQLSDIVRSHVFMNDFGQPAVYLGVEIDWSKAGAICLSQKWVIEKLLVKYGKQDTKGIDTPMNTSENVPDVTIDV